MCALKFSLLSPCAWTLVRANTAWHNLLTSLNVSGEFLTAEAISSPLIFLEPPNKLVLEISTTGRYFSTQWRRNGIPAGLTGFTPSSESFVHFGEIYSIENTTLEDVTAYDVKLLTYPNSAQVTPPQLNFTVKIPSKYAIFTVLLTSPVSYGASPN